MSRKVLLAVAALAAVTLLLQPIIAAAPPRPPAVDDPFAPDGDDDPFSIKPKETKVTAKPKADDPFAAESAEAAPPKPAKVKDPKPSPTAKFGAGQQAIEKALRQPTSVDFHQTPLEDVLEYLKDFHKIEILLDRKALKDVGIEPAMAVTVTLKNVSLRSVLDLMLRQLDLAWTIRSEVLLITTPEEAEEMLITKAYDVADLVTFRDQNGQLWEDYDELIDTISGAIAPETWAVGGGDIAGGTFGAAKVIIVSQTYQTHQRIAEFLEKLRTIAAKHPSDGQPPRRTQNPQPWGGCFGGRGGFGRLGGQGTGGQQKGVQGMGGGFQGMGGGFF